ncbi:hypothetical protein HGRIS_007541 [Hohenbuehelia grisea]|uniref:Uncharacterized protein n=1 Tax=Hohenbuehelia grisea TaxID=104357 RepID=A0ABR3J5J7_9AGAR
MDIAHPFLYSTHSVLLRRRTFMNSVADCSSVGKGLTAGMSGLALYDIMEFIDKTCTRSERPLHETFVLRAVSENLIRLSVGTSSALTEWPTPVMSLR